MKNKNHRENIQYVVSWLLFLVLVINFSMLIFYNTVTYRIFFNSDAAVKNLLAGEIFKTGEFFPKDWNYVNNDLWVITGHLFILPLLVFFKNGFVLHAVAGIITASLILTSIWFLLKELEISAAGRYLFLAILTTGISSDFANILFGEAAYGSILYLVIFELFFVIHYLKNVSENNRKILNFSLVAFSVITFLIFLSNPGRALAICILPLLIGLVYIALFRMFQEKQSLSWSEYRGIIVIILIIVFAGIIGMICHRLVLTNVNIGVANPCWLGFDGIVHNFSGVIMALMNLVGGLPTKGRPVLSAKGIYEAFHLVFAIVLLVTPFFIIANIKREVLTYKLLVMIFSIVSFGIVAFFNVFTTVPNASNQSTMASSAGRYFSVSVIILLITLIMKIDYWVAAKKIKLAYLFLSFLLLPFLTSGYFILVRPALGGTATNFDRIIEVLKTNKLNYGFASYWNANVLTVLSTDEVNVRPVVWETPPYPFRWLSSNAWYRADACNGPTFFLFKGNEYSSINWRLMETYLGSPIKELREGDWRIVVYPFNVAERLPGWDNYLTKPLNLEPSVTLHKVGRLVRTQGGTFLEAGPGETGWLAYGPYIDLIPGKYEVSFEIVAEPAEGVLGTVEVAMDSGNRIIAKKDLTGRWPAGSIITLPFEVIEKGGPYEFRVFTNGITSVKLQAITVRRKTTA